ncbi:ABC-type transporter, ATPase component: HAAT family [Cupriavidus necator]|uniref:ABC transporter ATP-binding protein n=1 Tax=Cupriavidus necator (strain ATCC 17699 / DSM 428 / KCTC 22496 / NCIMB 10442 / H16 / Stanier 337) TaxID=381666 RepID=Q0KAY8_CUPNH|nr:ABC transporter ATP-binding protein [Cupriavidus necator]QCC00696.1 ABC transporter ATP-binding protein [Cupriavidus necator H16]QQB76479.1 ABC transporter ATP-binding protein [Cupriavidus necator]WKA42573.1 ABC transporter ATP-binding protein [Cupriavidus necator]CAJ92833.1 ABC-type transporter, ATPase component: HAAT family [Cupriavidus necator H16]
MSNPLLKLDGVSVNYGRIEAARAVSLEVHEGEFVSIIGSNGAGKSSTLKAIAGVVKPVAGAITYAGKQVHGRGPHEMVACGIAMVPEGRYVFADQTVEDNLILGGYIHAQRKGVASLRGDIDRIYDLFSRLKERRLQAAGSLSGGEQQMLAIGRGLLSKPRLLMIDEVSLGLAPKVLDFLFPVLKELNRQGLAILLVEQLAVQALSVTTRAYVMENGRITMSGPSAQLAGNPAVMEAYLGKAA